MFDRIEQSRGREGRGRFPARAPNRAAVHESYAEFRHLILRMGPAGPTGKSKRPGARKRSNTAQLQRNHKRHSVCVCHHIIGPGAGRQGGHPHVRARVRTRVCACAYTYVRVHTHTRVRVCALHYMLPVTRVLQDACHYAPSQSVAKMPDVAFASRPESPMIPLT